MTNLDLSETYKQELFEIEKAQDCLLQRCAIIMKSNSPVYMPDFFVLGALKRGMALCAGFTELFKQNNYTCAATMLRMQVDTAARLYALQYVEDKTAFTEKLISGHKFTKLKDKDGNQLKDFWLIRKLAQIEPWISGVYEKTSDFVHLTGTHFFSTLSHSDCDDKKGEDRTFKLAVGPKDPLWPPQAYDEILAAFLHATKTVERVALMYLEERERGIANLPPNWQELSRTRNNPKR